MIVGMQFHAYAQSSPDDWTISTQVKKSDCQSNGSIQVINTNDGALFNHSYSLQENTPGGLKKEPQTSPVFNFLPAGTYTVTVTAQLKLNPTQKFTRTLNNVVVPDDYKPLDATHNQERSRSTFVDCPTGNIVLNITNPKPGLVFKITKAPAGVTQGVIAAKDNGDGTYTLAGDSYPAGTYEVQVSDQCHTRSVHFDIKVISKLPNSDSNNYLLLNATFPKETDNFDENDPLKYSCNSPIAFVRLSQETRASKELMQHIKDGQFQIGMSPVGREPSESQFKTLKAIGDYYYSLDISPNKVSDFYSDTESKVKLVFRLKSCPTVKSEIVFRIPTPTLEISRWPKPQGCDKYTNAYSLSRDCYGILCYPVKVNIREGSKTGPIIDTETFNDPNDDLSSKKAFEYGKKYFLELVDANGLVVNTYDMIQNFSVDFKQPKIVECCTKFKDYFNIPAFKDCIPYDVEILESATHKSVYKGTVTSAEGGESPALDFEKGYIYKFTKGTITFNANRLLNTPKINYELYGAHSCKKDVGIIRFSFSYNIIQERTLVLRQGTKEISRITTQAPWVYYYTKMVYMPAGKYQMDVIEAGCPKETIDIDWQGFYNHDEFTADLKQTCTGLEVTPRGQATLNGKPIDTFYRIIGGDKDGYKDRVISLKDVENGDKFTITKEGTYLIGFTVVANSDCFMDTIKVNYTYKNLKLASQHTSAYACGGGSTDGHILIKAEEGVAPYRYELWDENNTTRIMGAGGTPLQPLEILSNGVAHFVHGVAGDTYTVRVIDACNNSFPQKVTITDLTSLTIASSESNAYCAGDPIQLQCLPLHQYKWYRPNAKPGDPPFSTEQNPIIPNARVEDSGLYKVVAEPLFCAKGIEGYVNITVHPCHAPVNPHLMNRVPR